MSWPFIMEEKFILLNEVFINKLKKMRNIIRLTESELVNLVKRVISEEKKSKLNESIQLANPNFVLNAVGGFLKDGKGNLGCVKVEAPWPIGTFAAGISGLKMNSDGSASITPTDSKIGSVTVLKPDLIKLANAWNSNQIFTTSTKGSTIKIDKKLVPWCKKQWSS